MITNKKIALTYRVAALLFAISGILSTCYVPGKGFRFSSFLYYTIQSNLLAIFLFAILSFKTIRSFRSKEEGVGFYPRLGMVIAVDLFLTLFVYWVLLAPTSFDMGNGNLIMTFQNLSVHLITPLLCLLDYLLFTKSNHLKYSDVFTVTIYPLFFVALSTVIGLTGYVYSTHPVDGLPVHVPYFFIDYQRVGWYSALYILGLVAIFLVIGNIFYWFDKKVTKKVLLK